jgi:hypothetical protein
MIAKRFTINRGGQASGTRVLQTARARGSIPLRSITSPPGSYTPSTGAGKVTARTRFVVVLEGTAGADTAHAHTLRYLLKYLLRSRSLRCVELRQVDHHRDDDGGER